MHRNSILSVVLITLTVIILMFCSCSGGEGTRDLSGLAGFWDYYAKGTMMVSLYSTTPVKGNFNGRFSIYPLKIEDRQGYEWDWDYDGQRLQFQRLKAIPIPDPACDILLIEGKAKFDITPIEYGDTAAEGVLRLDGATITCQRTGKEGPVTGTFSIHMIKKSQ